MDLPRGGRPVIKDKKKPIVQKKVKKVQRTKKKPTKVSEVGDDMGAETSAHMVDLLHFKVCFGSRAAQVVPVV
jgi:hypothetical protein